MTPLPIECRHSTDAGHFGSGISVEPAGEVDAAPDDADEEEYLVGRPAGDVAAADQQRRHEGASTGSCCH